MNKSVNVILGDSLRNSFCAFDMDVLKIKVPKRNWLTGYMMAICGSCLLCWIASADEIVDDVGMSNTLLKRLSISYIKFLYILERYIPQLNLLSAP